MFHKHNQIIISPDIKPTPAPHEKHAATILAKHYDCTIIFLQPATGYKIKTPDFIMQGKTWELKSPRSSKSHKIEDNLKQATRQSAHIVFDSSRTKLSDERIERILYRKIKQQSTVTQIIWIKKDKTVIDIPKK